MKFLIALSVLASTTAFANREAVVKCYDTAQGRNMEMVYKMVSKHGHIKLVYPTEMAQLLEREDGCLETARTRSFGSEDFDRRKIRFCREEGQRVNGLVPVEVTYGQESDTVYCDKKIWKWMTSPAM